MNQVIYITVFHNIDTIALVVYKLVIIKHLNYIIGEVEQILQSMLLKLSANEQKWLIRLLLKDMRLGIAHTKILKTYHDDANDLYDVCNDLIKVI